MEVEIKIEPHSSSMLYYCIFYRFKKKFNLFNNTWKRLDEVWDGGCLNNDHPVLISDFDDAVKFGERLKNNPNLIKEHNDIEDKKYRDAKKRRDDYYNSRNKTTIL